MAIDIFLRKITAFLLQHQDINDIALANCRLRSGSLRRLFALLKYGLPLPKRLCLDSALGDDTMEFETREAHRGGMSFVLESRDYPSFHMAEPERK